MAGFIYTISKMFRRSAVLCAVAPTLLLVSWARPVQARSDMPRAEKHENRHAIDQLEDQWRNAILKGDTDAMSSLLADDYMAITPFGTLQNRDEALDSMRSGRFRITLLNLSDRKVRFYGRTALVTSIAEVEGTSPEGDISGSYRYTRVYARTPQGGWKIVNFEANRIHQPGDHQ
jgi:ketosteroid isomerase-like protein